MDDAPISWIDVVSPIVTFITVVIVPVALAVWVIFRTVTDPTPEAGADGNQPVDEPEEISAE